MKSPDIWIVVDDQLKIFRDGEVVVSIPDHQFLKMIASMVHHLDYKE